MSQFARGLLRKIGINLGDLLIITGIIMVSLPLLWSIRSNYLQQQAEREWNREVTTDAEDHPVKQHIWPPTKIIIDRIDLDAVVIEGYSNRDLDKGPMHLARTALPGDPGNCCIAAHKEKWFRKLRILEPGDSIVLVTPKKKFTYMVTGQKTVKPSNLKALAPTPNPTITLITCTGIPYGGSKNRLLVMGRLRKVEVR